MKRGCRCLWLLWSLLIAFGMAFASEPPAPPGMPAAAELAAASTGKVVPAGADASPVAPIPSGAPASTPSPWPLIALAGVLLFIVLVIHLLRRRRPFQ